MVDKNGKNATPQDRKVGGGQDLRFEK